MSRDNDGLPSYNQIFKMDNIATAPLLDERFPESIFGMTKTLKFEWDSDSHSNTGIYYFFIRDPAGCLQAKGKVADRKVTLFNINGSEMFQIFENNIGELDGYATNARNVRTFEVKHKNVNIGSIRFMEREPAENCLKIIQRTANPQIIVRSLKIGDFAIFRDNVSSTPLCNIQMSDATTYTPREFNGTIVFQPETEITVEEQLLCTAAAIAFKVSMKQITTAAQEKDSATKCLCSTFGIFIFLGIFLLFYIALDKWG